MCQYDTDAPSFPHMSQNVKGQNSYLQTKFQVHYYIHVDLYSNKHL